MLFLSKFGHHKALRLHLLLLIHMIVLNRDVQEVNSLWELLNNGDAALRRMDSEVRRLLLRSDMTLEAVALG